MTMKIRFAALFLALWMIMGLLAGCRQNAVGIRKTRITKDGELVIVYTDGTQENLGVVVGSDGKDGSDGTDAQEPEISLELAGAKALRSAVSIASSFTGKWSSLRHEAYGAGVIYQLDKEKGNALILTNFHVVYSQETRLPDGISDQITVFLYGSELLTMGFPASYVGGSLEHDVAVLSVENCDELKQTDAEAVTFAADDRVYPGQRVFAVGNPETWGTSLTAGVVSVESEYVDLDIEEEGVYMPYRVIRTDAAVNHGNSGGGLYNERGELVGLVHARSDDVEVENVGYAIPAQILRGAVKNILDHCLETDRTQILLFDLGLDLEPRSSKAVYDPQTGLVHTEETVWILDIDRNSPLKDQLYAGDEVKTVALNDEVLQVTRHYELDDLLLYARVGDTVQITVLREQVIGDVEEVTVSLTLTEAHCK